MNDLVQALSAIRTKIDFVPQIGLVLGSGLGTLARCIDTQGVFSFSDIPNFPVSTVAGHDGKLLFGTIDGVPVVLQQGRIHYYEGYTMDEVVFPIRLMRLLGTKAVILTNAAGGISRSLAPGDFMMLRDHIAAFVPSPLRGANDDTLGTRFPDMSAVYDETLRGCIRAAAADSNISLHEGVYLQAAGPQYETPAEIRMFAALGADAVGMSTACEAIAAVHCGLRVAAVSCITNAAAGILPQPLSHEEVQTTAGNALPKLETLLKKSVRSIAKIL